MATPRTDRPLPSARPPSFLTSLRVQVRVLSAVMIRDLVTRYGRENFGFLWAVLEPLILTVGVMVLWSAIKPPYQNGIKIVSFVLTGYMLLTLWRHMTDCNTRAIRRNVGLLYHRNVTLFDAVFSRFAIEFLGSTTALVFVSAVLITAGLVEPIHDYGLVLFSWFTMGALATGIGLIIAAGSEYSEVVERLVQPVQYFLLPISGCFFMADWLPYEAQRLVLYVPMLHIYEMLRAGYFGPGVQTHFDPSYPLIWALLTISIGGWMLAKVKSRVGLS